MFTAATNVSQVFVLLGSQRIDFTQTSVVIILLGAIPKSDNAIAQFHVSYIGLGVSPSLDSSSNPL